MPLSTLTFADCTECLQVSDSSSQKRKVVTKKSQPSNKKSKADSDDNSSPQSQPGSKKKPAKKREAKEAKNVKVPLTAALLHGRLNPDFEIIPVCNVSVICPNSPPCAPLLSNRHKITCIYNHIVVSKPA